MMDTIQKELSHFQSAFDLKEIITRAVKYLLEGFVVAVAAYFLPQKTRLEWNEIMLIGLTAAATFAILDLFSPSTGNSVRSGAGFTLGSSLVGGLPLRPM
jgi:ABC-type Co2+ transport system permease subunit